MLRSVCTFRSVAVRCRSACSLAGLEGNRKNDWRRRTGGGANSNWSRSRLWIRGAVGVPLLGLSWLVTIKDMLGLEPLKLDDDPLKDKVKMAWLKRKQRKYTEAVDALHEALQIAELRKEPLPISRVYDELANTYYEMGNLDDAEKLFRMLIHRLLELHGKREKDPEFIGISLKLADIFAQKGEIESAESGFRHCVTKQMQVVEENMKKFIVAQGALMEVKHLVETHGAAYTDPLALFGMCLEQYAHFIVNYRDETRLAEAEEFMDEVLKISYQMFGAGSLHTINMLNNFGAALILKNRFELARKYLALGADRVLHIDECSKMLPGYYCNYAEALFHCGKREEALKYARRAVDLSHSEEPRIRTYAQNFLAAMEADVRKSGSKKGGWLW